jgi:hypothetical protein
MSRTLRDIPNRAAVMVDANIFTPSRRNRSCMRPARICSNVERAASCSCT